MRIAIDFEHPYFDEETVLGLTPEALDQFYHDANEVNQLNLFFVLEATLHRLEGEWRAEAAARCAFLMAYYLFTPLTPPASQELAAHYIDRALKWHETPEYRAWKALIDQGN